MLGNFNFRRPNPSGHEEHIDRNAQPVERLALPSTTLSQRFSRVGMDRRHSGVFPTIADFNLSLAPAGRAAVAEGLPGMRWVWWWRMEWQRQQSLWIDGQRECANNVGWATFVTCINHLSKIGLQNRERAIGNVNVRQRHGSSLGPHMISTYQSNLTHDLSKQFFRQVETFFDPFDFNKTTPRCRSQGSVSGRIPRLLRPTVRRTRRRTR